jgi:GT2 family glycosyltransferase
MKFSIVITTYNRLPLLRRAIESALAQTWPCEVVVADDCSSDGTAEYVQSLGDRVVYYRNSVNLGHSATMNAGVRVAKGDWIKPVDDDDYLAPNCIEEMSRAIALHPEAVLCSCQAAQVDAEGKEICRTRQVFRGKACYILQEDIHYGMLLEQVPFGTPIQVAFHRDAFVRSGGWDSSLTSCDDIDSWIKIAQFGDALFINQLLAYRTNWSGNSSQKIPLQNRRDTNILMKEKIYALVNEKHRAAIPSLEDIRSYLKLHWSLVALQQVKALTTLRMIYPVMFSLSAWKLLAQDIYSRKNNQASLCIYKEIILPRILLCEPEASSTALHRDASAKGEVKENMVTV